MNQLIALKENPQAGLLQFLKIREDYYLEVLKLLYPLDFTEVKNIFQAYAVLFQRNYYQDMVYSLKKEPGRMIEEVSYQGKLLFRITDSRKEIKREESQYLLNLRNRKNGLKEMNGSLADNKREGKINENFF